MIAVVLIVDRGAKGFARGCCAISGEPRPNCGRWPADFRKQFDDALKEAELDDVKNPSLTTFASSTRRSDIKKAS